MRIKSIKVNSRRCQCLVERRWSSRGETGVCLARSRYRFQGARSPRRCSGNGIKIALCCSVVVGGFRIVYESVVDIGVSGGWPGHPVDNSGLCVWVDRRKVIRSRAAEGKLVELVSW